MTHPELSQPPTSLRKKGLELARLVCLQECLTMRIPNDRVGYSWIPSVHLNLSEPIELRDVTWSSHPRSNHKFMVKRARLYLPRLGMDAVFAQNFGDAGKFDDSLNDDLYARDIYEKFFDSYAAHDHAECGAITVAPEAEPVRSELLVAAPESHI